MTLLGIHLTLMIGPGPVAVPVPPNLAQSIDEVKVTHTDEGRSGFQITFTTGRSGPLDIIDYPLLTLPLLEVFNRVIVLVTFGVMPQVLIDGVITHRELQPGEHPGQARVTITGEDVSVMMDREERSAEYPAQDETVIANQLILRYAQYGLIPEVIPPVTLDPPLPIERTPVQQGTDLDYLERMARRYGYVFYVVPGPVPFTNTAHWGPRKQFDVPQSAITVNMGAETNATIGAFHSNGLGPTTVSGHVQDRQTNQTVPVQTIAPLRVPLSTQPMFAGSNTRVTQFRDPGVSIMEAFGRAQGTTDAAGDAVTVEGELDASVYGDTLTARGFVGVRGTGYAHDGLWYVKKVSHDIKPGSYKQAFTLTRDGHGSTVPVVVP
jgi:hypothetical protein